MARVSEIDVSKAVEQYLATQPNRSATIYQIKQALPNYLSLSAEDRQGPRRVMARNFGSSKFVTSLAIAILSGISFMKGDWCMSQAG